MDSNKEINRILSVLSYEIDVEWSRGLPTNIEVGIVGKALWKELQTHQNISVIRSRIADQILLSLDKSL